MTVSPADFLRLPYSADLSEGGIAYALRLLARENTSYERLIRLTAEFAAQLALRRHLARLGVPFEVESALPLDDLSKYRLRLGARRCEIQPFFVSRPSQIKQALRNPEILLNAPALVSAEADAAEGRADSDFCLFAFVFGAKADSLRAEQPRYFLHILPPWWSAPAHWRPLGEMILKSEATLRVEAELHGLDEARGFLCERLILPPKTRVRVKQSFYSLSSIHLQGTPAARLGISVEKRARVIAPQDWRNIRIDGAEIFFAGYLSRGEFRRKAERLPPQADVFQYSRTRFKNLAVPVSALRPMRELFERARS